MNNIHPTILQALQPFICTNSENNKTPTGERLTVNSMNTWNPQDEETEVMESERDIDVG